MLEQPTFLSSSVSSRRNTVTLAGGLAARNAAAATRVVRTANFWSTIALAAASKAVFSSSVGLSRSQETRKIALRAALADTREGPGAHNSLDWALDINSQLSM